MYAHCQSTGNLNEHSDHPVDDTIEAELITGDQARELEPALSKDIAVALLSHSTGIIDSQALISSLEQDVSGSENGEVVYSSAVVRVDPYEISRHVSSTNLEENQGWVVQVKPNASETAGQQTTDRSVL